MPLRSFAPALALLLLTEGCAAQSQLQAANAPRTTTSHRFTLFGQPTLWELAEEADDIVLVDAGETDDITRFFAPDYLETHVAVLETWKGNGLTRIGRFKGRGCGFNPELPPPGARAVLFAKREEDGTQYLMGIRTPTSAAEVAELRTVVKRAIADQARGRGPNDGWVMLAVMTRATRWDGLRLLSTKRSLSADELAAVADAYVAQPSVDAAVRLAFGLLKEVHSPELDNAFASSIEALPQREGFDFLVKQDLMVGLAEKRGCALPVAEQSSNEDTPPEQRVANHRQALNARWEELKRTCGLHPHPIEGAGTWTFASLWSPR